MLKRTDTFVGTISAIDLEARRVKVSHFDGHSHELIYDRLIIALGAETNFFDLPGVEDSCLTLKTLGDAVSIRNQHLSPISRKPIQSVPRASASLC